MDISEGIAALALVVAAVSLIFSYRSWQVGRVQSQAALFTERFKVFSAAKDFLNPWFRDAKPDLQKLGTLIDAWERSMFLFEPPVTQFLREMWLAAVRANYLDSVIKGEAAGDHGAAVDEKFAIIKKYLAGTADEPHLLVEAFKEMKIHN